MTPNVTDDENDGSASQRGGRLLRRTFVISLLLVSGGLIASGALELYFRYQENIETVEELQREMAHAAAFKINQFVQDIEQTMRASTQTQSIVTAGLDESYRFELIKLLKISPAITEAVAVRADGREFLKVSRVRTILPDDLKDRSSDELFIKAREGKSYFGKVYFIRKSEPYMTITVPIERFAGEVVGVLIGEVNLKYIWDVVSAIKVGKAGYAYVVSGEGDLIAHPDISYVLEKRNLNELGQVKAALVKTPGILAAQPNLAGLNVFAAYAPIPDLGWAVLVERPVSEAYGPLYASTIRTSLLLLVGLAMAILASLLIGRRVVRPIGVLRQGAARIGSGDLDHRLEIKTGDELEALADEFNSMAGQLKESYANLEQKVEDRTRELTESLEQQTATSEVLRVIASSPTDIQPVLDTVIENAVKLAGAKQGHIRQFDGEFLRPVAHYGESPEEIAILRESAVRPSPEYRAGRALLEKRVIHVHDVQSASTPAPRQAVLTGARTLLAVPLLREGTGVGVISIWRDKIEPFTDRQIDLVKTFADQAVIAIENVRLFKELEVRNRDLTESLEQQTATSEILRVIAGSPSDLQPVLDAVAVNAARLCDASDAVIVRLDGNILKTVAQFGSVPGAESPRTISRGFPMGRAVVDGRTVHVRNLEAELETEFPDARSLQESSGARTVLATPLVREGTSIGGILIRRTEERPFTEKQVALLETFADQAVIAIENVRLFQELQARTRDLAHSVEELEALGEVGQAVSSTLDLDTVLTTIVSRAVQLSGTSAGLVYEFSDAAEAFILRASHRVEEEFVEALRKTPIHLGEGALGQAAASQAPAQVPDIVDEREATATRLRPILTRLGYRSLLAVPLLREKRIIGGLVVLRREPSNFSTEVVNLLQTFATQSALAIQNARLFQELETKSVELEAANKHKSQFLANVSHELRTPLNSIIGFTRIVLRRSEGQLAELQKQNLQKVLISSEHLLSLINGLLDLAKIEAGRLEVFKETFRLEEIIQVAGATVEPLLKDGRVRFVKDIAPDLPPLNSDRDKLKQVVLNLLSNAAKFTEQGEIRVAAWRKNGSLKIAVSDTGIGMKQEALQYIFDEFRQVDMSTTKKYGGTGLGLAIVKKLVNLLGGDIGVESEEGKGSKFTITMPFDLQNP